MKGFYTSFVCVLGHTWLGSVAAVPEELRTDARIIPAVGERRSLVYVL